AGGVCSEEPTAVVYIDGKGEESALWVGKARIAVEPEEILAVVQELLAEGRVRRDLMRAEGVANFTPTQERPRLLVVVDEGAEIIAMDDPQNDLPLLRGLRSLARTGRSRCIDVVWCTQKPTLGDGIDRQINGVMTDRAVLRTAGETENRQVLGSEWHSHELTGAGQVYIKDESGRGPDQAPVLVWDLSDDAQVVKALPDREPWSYQGPQITLSDDDEDQDDADVAEDWMGVQRDVLRALRDSGEARSSELAREIGCSDSAVKQALSELRAAGRVEKGPGHRAPWRLLH
ncbi:ArsR family transcriptional regulator, partial [Marinitenerispora sediminis]